MPLYQVKRVLTVVEQNAVTVAVVEEHPISQKELTAEMVEYPVVEEVVEVVEHPQPQGLVTVETEVEVR
jgi:hypothetical protein